MLNVRPDPVSCELTMNRLTIFISRIKFSSHKLGIILLLALLPNIAAASWWNNNWNYMVPIVIPTGATINNTIVVNVNFNALLTTMGVVGTFDANSPRIVRADNATLSTDQEFTDAVYNGATDPTGNGQGEIRFILQDVGPTTYYLYFDVTANGPKPPNPQMPINGNFERGVAGTATPTAWLASTASDPDMDTQVRPAETVSVDDSADGAWPSPVNTDGNPNTGLYSYLMGYRTNYDEGGTATLTKTFTVPSTNPGSFNIRIKPEGWDSATNGDTNYYDFIRVRLLKPSKSKNPKVLLDIVGPQLNNYLSCPFSPNYMFGVDPNPATYSYPSYGYYNDWDNGYEYYVNGFSDHKLGMSATYNGSQQPWTLCTASLTKVAGQTVTLEIRTDNTNMFNSWFLVDDVEWSVVDTTLGTPISNFINPGSFNAYDSTTPAGAITGNITTKISGASFGTDGTTSVDIIALNPTKTAILTTFTGPVKVELLDSSSGGTPDSNGCNAGWPTIQTLVPSPIFLPANNGRLTVLITENNAWPNARVRITYPAFGPAVATGCSTDNFAIRPYSFNPVSASDQDWATAGTARTLYNTSATGGNVHKAGQPFTLGATAINAAGNTTANYGGNPAATLTACVLPASCTPGILGTGIWSSASGVITTSTATYSDVGAFAAQLVDSTFASVDASQESPTLLDITSAPFNIGRFVPDHFDLLNPNTPVLQTFGTPDAQCNALATTPIRSFTYIGQAFGYLTVPQATVYARNAGGGTTVNYVNTLWHIPAGTTPPLQPLPVYSGITIPATTNTLDTGLVTPPTVAQNNGVAPNNGGPGTGLVSVNPTDQLAYIRNLTAPLQPPFNADISLTLSVTDSSESGTTGNGTINTLNPATFSNITFDAGNLFYYGRLALSNASGSVNLPLPVPMQAQYWNGTNFVSNVADNCTDIAASNIVMGNYQKNLAPCKTAAALSNPLLGGKGNLTLSAPGAGNNGSVDLAVNLAPLANGQTCSAPDGSICLTASPPNDQTCLTSGGTQSTSSEAGLPWLQGKWSGTDYDLDPIARATFGIYKNANQFIFIREIY